MDASGAVLESVDEDRVHPTASVGKVFLLCEAAERIVDGRLDPDVMLTRDPTLQVADSGLWQHLATDELPVIDVCQLIAAVSDNWATNVLLDVIGLAAVERRADALGCERSRLHDRVRDRRLPEHPAALSSGTARELAEVARRIHRAASGAPADGITDAAGAMVERWLIPGVDLSLVAAPFRLDPLAHATGRVVLWSKTGCDADVRADMGVAWSDGRALSYAALATWEPGDSVGDDPIRLMHGVGDRLAARLGITAA